MKCSTIRTGKRQPGFTIIELIIGVAVTGLLSAAVCAFVTQTYVVNASTRNHTAAIREVQNAGYWISRDAVGAQEIVADSDPGTSGLVTFRWSDWSCLRYEASYYFDGSCLYRSLVVGGAEPVVSMVGEHIDNAATTIIESGSIWVLTVKATVGGFPWPSSETRTYEVLPRPPGI